MKKYSLLGLLALSLLPPQICSASGTYVGFSGAVQDITSNVATYRAFLPGLFIGWYTLMDREYYFAGELSGTAAATLTNNYVNRNDSMRMTPKFAVSFIPGMLFSQDSMGFFRIGFVEGNLSAQSTWRPGIVAGLGLESAFSPCWSVRAEYDNTTFSSVSTGTPRSDEFTISLKYSFE